MKIKNEKFSNALNHIPQKIPPIWFMRQAGRYHSHYQGLKQSHTFEELCKNPNLAAETALGPINDFDFDVAILFSDILFVLEALGMSLKYDPGPIFSAFIDEKNCDGYSALMLLCKSKLENRDTILEQGLDVKMKMLINIGASKIPPEAESSLESKFWPEYRKQIEKKQLMDNLLQFFSTIPVCPLSEIL